MFTDVSRLKPGQSVRVAGIRVGTVDSVSLQPDKKVVVKFDADRNVVLTEGTRAAVRYLNLVGDRYLELVDGPGSTKHLPAGGQIPVNRTAPALDLDLLLGGLKPVTQGLNARDVNALTSGLLQVFQGQGGTLDSLFAKTTSFSNALADNDQTVQQLIDNLNIVVGTISKDGTQFSGAIDRLEQLVSGLSDDRDTIALRHRRPGQGNRLAGGSAGQRAAAAVRHHSSVESAGADTRWRQGPPRHRNREGAEELPQAGPTRRERRDHPVLPLPVRAPRHGSFGQDGALQYL